MPNSPRLDTEYLFTVSDQSLCDWQLSALARYSQHMKAAKLEMDAAVEQAVIAEVLSRFRENKEAWLEQARRTLEAQSVIAFPERKRA